MPPFSSRSRRRRTYRSCPFLSAAHSSTSRPGALCAQRATHTRYFERRDGTCTVLPGRLAHRHAPRRRWPRRGDRVSANCSTHAEKHVLASKPELKRMAAGLGRAEGPREAGLERCVGTIVFEEVGAQGVEGESKREGSGRRRLFLSSRGAGARTSFLERADSDMS